MSVRHWFDLVVALVGLVAAGMTVRERVLGRRGIPSTIGWVLCFLTLAAREGVPVVAPGLSGPVDKVSDFISIGLIVLLVSAWLVRRSGRQGSPSAGARA